MFHLQTQPGDHLGRFDPKEGSDEQPDVADQTEDRGDNQACQNTNATCKTGNFYTIITIVVIRITKHN